MRFIKPFFKNSDISSYFTKLKPSQYVVYVTNQDYLTQNDTTLLKHLKKYDKVLAKRAEVEPQGGIRLYALARPRDKSMYEGSKIVCPLRAKHNTFGFNCSDWYAATDVTFLTLIDASQCSIEYLVGILNSKVSFFWLCNRGKRKGESLELSPKPLSEIPIRIVPKEEQGAVIEIVGKILYLTQTDDYAQSSAKQARVKELKKQVDQMTYKIYGLTSEEIEIVEAQK